LLFIAAVVIPLIVGGVVAYVASRLHLKDIHGHPHRITGPEFGIVSTFIVLASLLITVLWGPEAARGHAASGYKQFYNGSVTRAFSEEIECSRDGPCIHEYECDPYNHDHVYNHVHGSGDTATNHTHVDPHTHYHECPEATHEYNYKLDTNVGKTITIASHIFAAEPQRWRRGGRLSSGVPRGEPERWTQSKQKLEAGEAEPVTVENEYTNFILPSRSGFNKINRNVDKFLKQGLLPPHTQNLDGSVLSDYGMKAAKVQFVKVAETDQAIWQDRLMAFNAALGIEKQGDLHIVVVPADQVSSPQDYINALTAYWQNKLGKWSFPKNGIALAIGVDPSAKTIVWSRAKTGMPVGNGQMLAALMFELENKPFNADVVLGQIKAQPFVRDDGKPSVRYMHGSGLADRIMFTDYPFKRACMMCKDKGDNGASYVYLKDSIPVSTGAKVMMFTIVFFFSLALWAAALFLDPIGTLKGVRSGSSNDPFRGSRSRIHSNWR
jgi:hypothetical protein